MIIAVAVMINIIFYVVEYVLQYSYWYSPSLFQYQLVLSAVSILVVLVVVFVFLISLEGIRDKMVGNLHRLLDELQSTNNWSPADLTKEICVDAISCNDELNDIVSVINQKSQQIKKHIEHLHLVNWYIHHEFNTPLATLALKLEKLQKEHPTIVVKPLLRDVYNLSTIIWSLGTLSSPWTQREKETVAVYDIIAEQVAILWVRYAQHTIELAWDRTVSIESNAIYFSMIIRNLVENALKYSDSWNKVIITVTKTSVTIKDFGEWMSAETMQFIWMPYWQKDPSRWIDHWFGLWLSLVKKLVDLLGMDIQVDSEEGVWTTVTLLFTK